MENNAENYWETREFVCDGSKYVAFLKTCCKVQ